jgi:hypothetical protein
MDEVIMSRRLIVLMLALVFSTSLQVGCNDNCTETAFRIEGDVVTPAGDPIPNAVIVISNANAENSDSVYLTLITDAQGHFSTDEITMNGCDPFDIFVNADRFTEKTVTFSATGDGELELLPDSLTITLQPD